MPDLLKLEPPFYRCEITKRLLPQARADQGALTFPANALDSEELCQALNAALKESIEEAWR